MVKSIVAWVLLACVGCGLARGEEPAKRIRVLYVEGYPRWEYRSLVRCLLRNPGLEVHCFLQSAEADFPQETSKGVEPLAAFPTTQKELSAYDVILVGDVDLSTLSAREDTHDTLSALRDFVSDGGGGLGFIAGPRHDPFGYASTPLAEVLPVLTEKASDKEAPSAETRPRLTEVGKKHPLTQIDAAANERLWNDDLPGLVWHAAVKGAKPQATVLAVWPVGERLDPLLAVATYGEGRALFLGTDETWRWRKLDADKSFYAFWRHAIDYLAEGKAKQPK